MNLERQSARAETPGAGNPDSFGGSPRSGTTSGCRSEVGFKPTKTDPTCIEYGIKAVQSVDGKRLYWMVFCGWPGRELWRFA